MTVLGLFHDGNISRLMPNPNGRNQSCGGVPKALSSSSSHCRKAYSPRDQSGG